MLIYLVRHAIAAARSPGILNDGARELTPEGIKKMRRHAAALAMLGAQIDEIWTSPLVRARQTAEILAAGLEPSPPLKTLTSLEPSGDFESLRLRLSQSRHLTAVALVGHEPFMGEFTGYLLGAGRGVAFRYKKGGIGLVEIDDFAPPLRGELCWLMAPKQLGLIGKA
ncbi:MAG: phosphohistidine phosphatase SixA [Planctomycetia bacterium]|jgi:phosphohistidine phosphatase|nr:phosphohistidine phosphatase SixA [Planctomycetia bacterium]MCC7316180.1 phosphohistidine phosphatase SixA [Planctomycetota bacterium]OQY97349.1 MAG: phosphohistidine phosphatase SixA [Planctomycetes bacterium UTPLA1]